MPAEGLPVENACLLLGVSVSGYYEWRDRGPTARMDRHTWLLDLIRMVHHASRGVCGTRRVHAELTLAHGIRIGHGQVELVMARAGVKGVPGHPAHDAVSGGRVRLPVTSRV